MLTGDIGSLKVVRTSVLSFCHEQLVARFFVFFRGLTCSKNLTKFIS